MCKSFLFFVAFALFSGCSNSSDSKAPSGISGPGTATTTESISYDYDGPGCKTGKLHYNSLAAFCDALQSPELSNKCNVATRKSIFTEKCPGKIFTESTIQTELIKHSETPKVADTPKAAPSVKTDEQQHSGDKFTVGVNAIMTLVRAKNYDGDVCNQTVFSGSFVDLYPKFPLSYVNMGITKNIMNENYGEMEIKMIIGGSAISSMEIDGRMQQLEEIRSQIQNGNSQNIRITESKKCAAKDPSLMLVDILMAPGVSTQKLDLDALVEVLRPDDQKKCIVVLSKTLGQLIQSNKPEVNLKKAKLRYHIWDHARQKDSGELVSNRIYFSADEEGFGSSETFLSVVVPAELTNSLIDQLTQHEKPVRMTESQECKGKRLDDPVLVYKVSPK